MSFHLLAFTASLGDVTNTDVPALTDDVFTIQNGHFLPSEDWLLQWAAQFSPNHENGRIVTPSLREISLPFIVPIGAAILPASDPNVADYRDQPLRLKRLEEIANELSTTGVGPSRVTALYAVTRAPRNAPGGSPITMRGTATTAAVANAWTTLAITWADTLPIGKYAVVGLTVQSTNAIAARVNFPNQEERPGSVSVGALTDKQLPMFLKGGLGEWGQFDSFAMPDIQVLANVADAVHVIYLDIVRM